LTCDGLDGEVERVYFEAIEAASTWMIVADRLRLDGPGGSIELDRALPPVGDASRTLADTLRAGEWQFLQVPGVAAPGLLGPTRSGDVRLIASGQCGLAGDVSFSTAGGLSISEVGWDAVVCTDGEDPRPATADALESVTAGRVEVDGSIRLDGPGAVITLGR
jgi:hypothetical protein